MKRETWKTVIKIALSPYSHRSLFRFDKLYVSRDVKTKMYEKRLRYPVVTQPFSYFILIPLKL